MLKTYLITSLLALLLFGWGQSRGYSLFADEGEREGRPGTGSARLHHK
jgi:hypothetical protein